MAAGLGHCSKCEGRGWVTASESGGVVRVRRCECDSRPKAEPVPERTGIPARYSACSLENFQTSASRGEAETLLGARVQCQRYVEEFLRDDGGFSEVGLLFVGPPGVGKTHLAVAVLRQLMTNYGASGRFADFTALIGELQASFEPNAKTSKQQILGPTQEADVLILDELGAQKPSEFVKDVLYLIINTRYAQRKPTLFTSNYDLPRAHRTPLNLDRGRDRTSQLDLSHRIEERLVSRLYEMARPISLNGVGDYRHEIRRPQHLV